MNNFYNINLPEFQTKYGRDWSSFKTITDDFNDYLFLKTWQLYLLGNVSTMPVEGLELILTRLGIGFDSSDTVSTKRTKLRYFVGQQKNKGLGVIYLDLAENVVGTRGAIYPGTIFGVWRWGKSRWRATSGGVSGDFIRWKSSAGAQFEMYIDVKTTDSDLLDQIVLLYSQKGVRPAFYRIYLIDEDYNILRTI